MEPPSIGVTIPFNNKDFSSETLKMITSRVNRTVCRFPCTKRCRTLLPKLGISAALPPPTEYDKDLVKADVDFWQSLKDPEVPRGKHRGHILEAVNIHTPVLAHWYIGSQIHIRRTAPLTAPHIYPPPSIGHDWYSQKINSFFSILNVSHSSSIHM
jgi:hypothetical protein